MRFKFFSFLLLFFSPLTGLAESAEGGKIMISIGALYKDQALPNLGYYIKAMYKWSWGIGAALALLMITIGAVQYVLAAGNIGNKDDAKKRITAAIFGFILLLGVATILTTISPKLGDVSRSENLLEDSFSRNASDEAKKIEERINDLTRGGLRSDLDIHSSQSLNSINKDLLVLRDHVIRGDLPEEKLISAIGKLHDAFFEKIGRDNLYTAWVLRSTEMIRNQPDLGEGITYDLSSIQGKTLALTVMATTSYDKIFSSFTQQNTPDDTMQKITDARNNIFSLKSFSSNNIYKLSNVPMTPLLDKAKIFYGDPNPWLVRSTIKNYFNIPSINLDDD